MQVNLFQKVLDTQRKHKDEDISPYETVMLPVSRAEAFTKARRYAAMAERSAAKCEEILGILNLK